MVRYCSVNGCLENESANKKRRFFRYPTDEERCKHWLEAVDRMDLESKGAKVLHFAYYVCDLHFTEADCPKKFLRRDVVPSLYLPHHDKLSTSVTSTCTQTDYNTDNKLYCSCNSQISQTSHSTQTTQFLSAILPQKQNLLLGLESQIKKRQLLESSTVENVTNSKESDMHPLLKKIIDVQEALKLNFQGNRYDQEYVMFALTVYFPSPAAYRFLSKIVYLPNIRTIQRRFSISTNFDENVIKCLQAKSRKLNKSEKYCIICADEVPLKRHLHYQINKDKVVGFHEINEKQTTEIATKAFVVMARGIFSDWKQPLAFCFLSESTNYAELNTWLENIIANMIEIDFNVCAFSSNQGSNFINMAENKFVSPDQPYFFVNGRKIYYIFDVPQLIKSVRNNLMNYDFVYRDDDGLKEVASWNDIVNMYNIDKGRTFRMTFKLTESHIKPNNFEKKTVKYATQVLSRTVAVAIGALVESGKLKEKCIGTAKFIELMNYTFDILNSSTLSDDCKYKKAFCEAEYQTNALEKAQRLLSGLRIINRKFGTDVTNGMKFIEGFMISIKAISSLASDLKTEGYDSLFTRKLNQDVFENYCVKVRPQGENRRKPTAIQFLKVFKEVFVENINRQSEYAHSAEDLEELLMRVEVQYSLRSEKNVANAVESSKRALQVGTTDYRFELPKENKITYVCGYLLKKCNDHHKGCAVLKKYIKSSGQVNDNNMLILNYLPEDFKQYIKQMDIICKDHFDNSDFYHVGSEIMTKINAIVFNLPCPCFPLEYMNKLFVRFHIFNVMQHNNRNFKDNTFTTKYFSVPRL